MTKIYVGYDESNNNSVPEYHVFVHSINNAYAQEVKEKPFLTKGKKRREGVKEIFDEMSNELDFRYVVLFDDVIKRLNEVEQKQSQKLKKILVLYTYLKSMNFNSDKIDMLLDGFIGNKTQTQEVIMFLQKYFPNAGVYTKGGRRGQGGDVKFPLINYADRIAYQFLKEFNKRGLGVFKNHNKSLVNLTSPKRLYPNVDEFIILYEQFKASIN